MSCSGATPAGTRWRCPAPALLLLSRGEGGERCPAPALLLLGRGHDVLLRPYSCCNALRPAPALLLLGRGGDDLLRLYSCCHAVREGGDVLLQRYSC